MLRWPVSRMWARDHRTETSERTGWPESQLSIVRPIFIYGHGSLPSGHARCVHRIQLFRRCSGWLAPLKDDIFWTTTVNNIRKDSKQRLRTRASAGLTVHCSYQETYSDAVQSCELCSHGQTRYEPARSTRMGPAEKPPLSYESASRAQTAKLWLLHCLW